MHCSLSSYWNLSWALWKATREGSLTSFIQWLKNEAFCSSYEQWPCLGAIWKATQRRKLKRIFTIIEELFLTLLTSSDRMLGLFERQVKEWSLTTNFSQLNEARARPHSPRFSSAMLSLPLYWVGCNAGGYVTDVFAVVLCPCDNSLKRQKDGCVYATW